VRVKVGVKGDERGRGNGKRHVSLWVKGEKKGRG